MTDKIECTHCNGYGSSWNDKGDSRCSQCNGSGLRKDQQKKDEHQYGVVYCMIGASNTPSIANGNTWEESKVS